MEVIDNVVLRAGERGIPIGTDRLGAENLFFDGLTIQGSKEAALVWAGDVGVKSTLENIVLAENGVGFDGWGTVELDIEGCRVHGNDLDDDNSASGVAKSCASGRPGFGNLTKPAGPDGTFFTADDPWLVDGGARLP